MSSFGYEGNRDSDNPLVIGVIEVTPDPPQRGKDLSARITGNLVRVLGDGAYVDITVKFGLIKLHSERKALADLLNEWGGALPQETGLFTLELSNSKVLEKEFPGGKYKVILRGYTKADEDAFSLVLTVNFT